MVATPYRVAFKMLPYINVLPEFLLQFSVFVTDMCIWNKELKNDTENFQSGFFNVLHSK